MAAWTRRQFGAMGLTQSPAGPYLSSLQSRFGGSVMLMIDVSGSMYGSRILQAAAGARAFVSEAVAAHYKVGVLLWNTGVVAVCAPATDGRAALDILDTLDYASGGNALDGPLNECHQILSESAGDRVVALFGDGDLSPKPKVLAKVAEMKADNIRFVTRGLGEHAAREFAKISDQTPDSVRVDSVDQLASGSQVWQLRSSCLQVSRGSPRSKYGDWLGYHARSLWRSERHWPGYG